jgi:membrane-associated phospholipid phosphatase
MRKLLFAFFLFCCMRINTFPQTVYELEVKREIVTGALSLGMGITPFLVHHKPEHIPDTFNKDDINRLDRSLVFSYNKPLDLISDNSAYGLALLPLISIIPNIEDSNTLLTYGVMYSEALLLTYGTIFTLKNAVIRYRPYMYVDGVPDGKEWDYYNSFPSGAVGFTFLGATFLSVTYSREFPESEWKIPIIAGSYTLAAGLASARILAGSHFLSDVCASALISSFYGWLIPWMHLGDNSKKLTIIPTGNGAIVSLKL